MSAAACAKERKRCLRHPQHAEQVGLDLIARLALRQLLHHSELPVASVVHDDVELAEVFVRARDRLEHTRAVCHVEREWQQGVPVLL